jgi:hypothetical protein
LLSRTLRIQSVMLPLPSTGRYGESLGRARVRPYRRNLASNCSHLPTIP